MNEINEWALHTAEMLLKDKDPDKLGMFKWEEANRNVLNTVHAEVFSGVTKVCVVPRYFDWVVKFDIYLPKRRDYCLLEAEYYADAKREGLETYFAQTYEVGIVYGRAVCIQEKVRCNEDDITSDFMNYVRTVLPESEFENEDEYCDEVWDQVESMDTIDHLQAIFGENIDRLIEFIEDHQINDLHAGNWGYTQNGLTVIVDFSGY